AFGGGAGGERVGEVAGGGAGHGAEAELAGLAQGHRHHAVLEGQGGEADRVVLDVELAHTQGGGEAGSGDQRGAAHGAFVRRGGGGHGQQLAVAPDGA